MRHEGGLRSVGATALVAIALAAGIAAPAASAAPGDLDPAFSTDGIALTGFKHLVVANRTAAYMATGPGNRTVVAASVEKPKKKKPGSGKGNAPDPPRDLAIARWTAKGALDRKFSGDGRTVVKLPGRETVAGVAQQSDGKVLVVATSQNDILVVRVTRKGDLDKSFSTDGRLVLDFGLEDSAAAVEVQPDGMIVVAGSARFPLSSATNSADHDDDFGVARLTPTGGLDPTFSGDGLQTIDFTTLGPAAPKTRSQDNANALAIGVGGRIIVTGTVVIPDDYSPTQQMGAAVLLPTGELDAAFNGGAQAAEFPGYIAGLSAGADSTGAVLAGGMTSGNFAAARFTAAGALDSTFAGDGTALIDVGSNDDNTDAMAIQADDKPLLAGGTEGLRGSQDYALVRLTTLGTPDPTFSEDGKLIVELSKDWDDADGVEIQTDGKIVVGGTVGSRRVGVTRHLVANGPPDFDADGVEDADDGCPDQFGEKANGCPKRKPK